MKKTTTTKLAAIGILLKRQTYNVYRRPEGIFRNQVKDVVSVSHKRRLKRAYKRNAVPGILHYLKGTEFKNEHGQDMANVIIKSL